jgi:VanZ family protein
LVAAGLLAGVIFFFTHLPNDRVPRIITRLGDDKLRHVAAYAAFAALLWGGVRLWILRDRGAFAVTLLVSIILAGVDELTQPLTGRTCSALDYLASLAGAVLGAGIVWGLVSTRARRVSRRRVDPPLSPNGRP